MLSNYNLKALFSFFLIQLVPFIDKAISEESKIFSAEQIVATNGQYCDKKKLIDIHAHAACLDDGGRTCFVSKRLASERVALGLIGKYGSFFDAYGVSQDTLKEQGSEYLFEYVSNKVKTSTCVEAVVLLAIDGSYAFDSESVDYENTDFMIRNDYVARNVKKYSNLFWAASVNPYRKDFKEEIDKSYKEGALFIKLIPPIQAIDLASDDNKIVNRIKEFYELLAKYKLPLLIHLDEEGTFSKELENKFRQYVGLSGLELALKSGVTVIVAHVASRDSVDYHTDSDATEKTYQQVLALMDKEEYKGLLYADISALPTIVTRTNHLCKVVKDFKGKEDRLLWGSDYPLNYWKTTSTILLGPSCDRSYISMTDDEGYAFSSKRHQWDRAIFLQKNMGASDEIFNSTRKFLLERKLLYQNVDGFLIESQR